MPVEPDAADPGTFIQPEWIVEDEQDPGTFLVLPHESSAWVDKGSVIPEVPWGVFLVSNVSEDWDETGRTFSLELLDKTTVVSQDAFETAYALPQGTPILQRVRSILRSSNEAIVIDESVDLRTSTNMVWDAGTSKLTVINDLLNVAGYNSLWMDGYGNLQATPRELPADRSVVYEVLGITRELRDGEEGIYRPDWTREKDSFQVPNKVIAVQAAGGEDAPALVGSWTNEDPKSPYSYQARGRWITHVLDSVETPEGTAADTMAFLQARARATLVQMSAVQAQVKVSHLPIPVRVGEAVQFANSRSGIDGKHIITRLKLEAEPLGLMSTELQEVISL